MVAGAARNTTPPRRQELTAARSSGSAPRSSPLTRSSLDPSPPPPTVLGFWEDSAATIAPDLTDSLAASLQRGLHIIEYHQQNPPAPRKSFVGLSFDHFALNPRQSAKASSALEALPEGDASSASTICSSCKKAMGTNEDHPEDINSEKQIVTAAAVTSNDLANASLQGGGDISSTAGSKRVAELEALCEEQAAKIKELSNLIEQQKKVSEDAEQCEDSKMTLDVNEREALEGEIRRLKDQVKLLTDGSTANDSLLDQIRNGSTDQEYELEKELLKFSFFFRKLNCNTVQFTLF